jgi:hypothetical protein
MHRNRLLFVCKRRHSYHESWGYPLDIPLSSGLQNSIDFVVDMLNGIGIEAKMVEVVDNNCIDREVALYRPTHVFIEAFWVVPEKFDVLMALHPRVRWIVRDHSETPFLANEGIAMEWIAGYLSRGVEISCNSRRAFKELKVVAHAYGANDHLVTHLPNYYPAPGHDSARPRPQAEARHVNIGCFGAIRPLKNQLMQAIAAMAFADNINLGLKFHINASRIEGKGEPILKNLRALFAGSKRHELVENAWMQRDDFLCVLQHMDIALQVSLTETFNIVSADAVTCAVPVVVSPEVDWLGAYAMASPHSAASITKALWELWNGPSEHRLFRQRQDLSRFLAASEATWGERFAC